MAKYFTIGNRKFNIKRCVFSILVFLAIISIIIKIFQNLDAREIREFNRDIKNYNLKLQILNQDKTQVAEFLVAAADNENKKIYGLMNLKHMPKAHGMLFYFKNSEVIYMWMKSTKIALDMIFIDSANIIVSIKTDAQPESLDIISSQVPIKKVLEINAGLVKKFNIQVGQEIMISK